MSSDLPSSNSDEDNILKCIFCVKEMADSVLLNCLHNACKACVENDARVSVTCPTCNVTTDIPTCKTNLLLSSRAHRSQVLKDVFSCTPCSNDGKQETFATVWCYTCQYSLCVDCQTHHSRLNSTHKSMYLCEQTNLSELYLPPARLCSEHHKELQLACFTCKDVRCIKCANDCYKFKHEVLPLDGPDALIRIQNSGMQVAASLSELKSAITLVQSHLILPEKVASAQQECLAILGTAKKAAVDSICNAYQKSVESLMNCWESLEAKSLGVQKSAEYLKNRVLWTDTYCTMAINSNDICGLFPQLDAVFAALNNLQEEARQLKEQIDPKMLVRCHVCLPGDLDLITAGWFGKAYVVTDDFSCTVDSVPFEDCDDYYTKKVATLQELEQLTQKVEEQQKTLTLQLQAMEQTELTQKEVLVATQNENKALLDKQKELQEQLMRERSTVEQLNAKLNSKEQQLVDTQNEGMKLLDQQREQQQKLLELEKGKVVQLQSELLSTTRQLVSTQNENKTLLGQKVELREELMGERGTIEKLVKELNSKEQQLDSMLNYVGKGVFLLLWICLLAILIQLFTDQGMGYESAFRTAVNRTIGITPPATMIFSQIQSFSNCLSPAYREFEAFPVYTGCQDAYIKGCRQPGVFAISRSGSLPFRAWCDFDSSSGWMVIQRRVDGTVDFLKRWEEYEPGFGNLWGEYWLGLDKMHLMTTPAVALSVYLESFDGFSAWGNYSTFSIGDAASRYTITVSGFNGSAGDSLSYHNGNRFTTLDYDNDRHRDNCAQSHAGSWWYRWCADSNLNGRYGRAAGSFANFWNAFKSNSGLKASIMRILA